LRFHNTSRAAISQNESATVQLNHDAQTGKKLWEAILGGNVSVSTITYAVKGKQYVCVMTGYNLKVPELAAEVPDMHTPNNSNAIYVFALP
jgi:hypothetical protein